MAVCSESQVEVSVAAAPNGARVSLVVSLKSGIYNLLVKGLQIKSISQLSHAVGEMIPVLMVKDGFDA
jgi:hypothetical protein